MALRFGTRSKAALKYVHPDLRKIHERVLNVYKFDHSVLEGRRTKAKQQQYFAKGRKKVSGKWRIVDRSKVVTTLDGVRKKSNHQAKRGGRGYATDSAPYPIDFKDTKRFFIFAGFMKAAAKELLIQGKITHDVRWGGDWDSDNVFNDQKFIDLPHFELVKPK